MFLLFYLRIRLACYLFKTDWIEGSWWIAYIHNIYFICHTYTTITPLFVGVRRYIFLQTWSWYISCFIHYQERFHNALHSHDKALGLVAVQNRPLLTRIYYILHQPTSKKRNFSILLLYVCYEISSPTLNLL